MAPRRALIASFVLLSGCLVPAVPRGESPTGDDAGPAIGATVTVAPSEKHQVLEGFGAAVAWHLEKILGNKPERIDRVVFSELGLDILRIRNRFQRSKPDDGNISLDAELVKRATRALGHPPKIMLSSWSPPAALKADGHEDCHNNKDCTLVKVAGQFAYEQFGDYWRDSLVAYEAAGVVPDWISIENEPSFIPPSWEGCKFEPSETADYPGYDRALAAVHEKIANLPHRPKILGPEVLGIHWGLLQKYLQPMNQELVDGVAHHLYEMGDDKIWDWRSPGPDSFVDEMQGAAAATKKPLFQTEFSTNEDKGIEGGFETAWLIHHSLVEEGVAAFLYWDLVWEKKGGLVSVNGSAMTVRDQYYSMKHYARFTDPGYVRVGATVDVPSVLASAFLSPGGDELTIVLLNTGGSAADVSVVPGEFTAARSVAFRTTYRPGSSKTWVDLGEAGTKSALVLPSRSVATLVLYRK